MLGMSVHTLWTAAPALMSTMAGAWRELMFYSDVPLAPDHTPTWLAHGAPNLTCSVFILFPKPTALFSFQSVSHLHLKFFKFSKRSSLLAFTFSYYPFYTWSKLWLFCDGPLLIFPKLLTCLLFDEGTPWILYPRSHRHLGLYIRLLLNWNTITVCLSVFLSRL